MKNLKNIITGSFILFCFVSFSQVQYTDEVPDDNITLRNEIEVDINQDQNIDFVLSYQANFGNGTLYFGQFTIECFNNNQVAISNDSVAALSLYDVINEDLNWMGANQANIQYVSNNNDLDIGNWKGLNQGFIGVRIAEGNNYQYGWIRLHRESLISMFLMDYAFEENPNQAIMAGDGLENVATSLFAENIANDGKATDIQISASIPIFDTVYAEYRLIIARANDSTTENLDEMLQIDSTRYIQISPQKFSLKDLFSVNLNDATLDKDGELLQNFTNYKAHLINMNIDGENHLLSATSSPFVIGKRLAKPQYVSINDVFNNESSSDLQVRFKIDHLIPNQNEYRVFYGTKTDMESFDLEEALQLNENHYTAIYSNDTMISSNLKANQKDISGKEIDPDIAYQAVVLNYSAEHSDVSSVLSEASRIFYLNQGQIFSAGLKDVNYVTYYDWDMLFSEYSYWTSGTNHGQEPIDLNRDGEADFLMCYHRTYSIFIIPLGENEVMITDQSNPLPWIDVLQEGELISDQYMWTNEQSILRAYTLSYDYYTHTGHLPVKDFDGNFYIALRIKINESWQYNWLKLYTNSFRIYYIGNGLYNDITGMPDLSNKSEISIFPNPASDFIKIELSNDRDYQNLQAELYNVMGQKVDEFNLNQTKSSISLSHLKPGLYLIVLNENGNRMGSKSIIVE